MIGAVVAPTIVTLLYVPFCTLIVLDTRGTPSTSRKNTGVTVGQLRYARTVFEMSH